MDLLQSVNPCHLPVSVMHEGQGGLTSRFFLLLIQGQVEGEIGCWVQLLKTRGYIEVQMAVFGLTRPVLFSQL